MNLDKLLKERDCLREEIENKRKQNEDVLLYIKGFLSKIADYVNFCNQNDVRSYVWHEFDGAKYLIQCNGKKFEVNLYNANATGGVGCCYVEYNTDRISHCLVGNNPTLETITEKDGTLKEHTKWFNRNIKTIIDLLEKDLEDCVRKQIDDAKKMLGK